MMRKKGFELGFQETIWTFLQFLKRARHKEKTTVAPPCKIAVKITRKRAKSNEGTQESDSNEWPPLLRHKSNKELIATVTHSSLVFILPEIPPVPEGSIPQTDSPKRASDP
ncbi:hypothetical protein PVK06_047143 [Gossypium arboreum]|uniref:Uncharacterized protein n=1 Tax=Gossypium arboreum TaxID=29729 RepID=A0ABR0MCL9_GOSAR|nr:hypothetical protein PVK06_047143 [Gossypium arboreum]